MSKPQPEEGFTQIPNPLLEHLAPLHLKPNDWRVLLFIIRKTYGFHKKVDYISNSQIAKGVNLHKSTVSHSLKRLHAGNFIMRAGKLVGLQNDWEQWIKLTKSPTIEKLAILPTPLTKSPTKVEGPLPENSPLKEKINYTKERDGGKLLSSTHKDLFNILKRCPAIKDSEAGKLPELLADYPGLNYALEFKKFAEWWPGPKKRKRPWATLRNWLERAQKDKVTSRGRRLPTENEIEESMK